jgi:hypothetical protein
MDEKRIPWNPEEFTPEIVAGIMPDGLNEYMHPDYPDLPYPDAINNVTWYKDPLITNDEPAPWQNYWEPEDPEHPWDIPYGSHYPPTR